MKIRIKLFLTFLLVVLFLILGIYIQTWLIMKGWNYFIADIFKVKEISIWGALLLSVIMDMLFGKFGLKVTIKRK